MVLIKKIVQDKLFLYDVKGTMHSNRNMIQKVLEDTGKEMGCEGNYYLIMSVKLQTNFHIFSWLVKNSGTNVRKRWILAFFDLRDEPSGI
jgi:hypothetical protein